MNSSNSFFRKIALFVGLALAGTWTFSVMAQLTVPEKGGFITVPLETEDDVPIEPAHKGVLYEDGFNSESVTGGDPPEKVPSAVEARDIVMVGSTMNYFVMPDANYNPEYYTQGDLPIGEEPSWANTQLTKSIFDWQMVDDEDATVSIGFVLVFQNPNETLVEEEDEEGTSPWAKITWETPGDFSIKITEKPAALAGTDCESGTPSVIPITVIDVPTIAFVNQKIEEGPDVFQKVACHTFDDGEPEAEPPVLPAPYKAQFPVTVNTGYFNPDVSDEIRITYNIRRLEIDKTEDPNYGKVGGVFKDIVVDIEMDQDDLTDGRYTLIGTIEVDIASTDKHGYYEITILSVEDHIARKCDVVSEEVTSGADKFTIAVLPGITPGSTFHVPNNF